MKLDIGCGLNLMKPLDEWVHQDGDPGDHIEIVSDFASIPLESESVDEIHSSDTVEHVPVWREAEVFREWNRILKVGGIFWGSTPDIDHAVSAYYNKRMTFEWFLQNLYGDRRATPHQHYILFNEESFTKMITKYGFSVPDYSGSPGRGDVDGIWWIVFKCVKLRNL